MKVDERDGVFTIAVASRLTGMHPQTLRKYERSGLLQPSRRSGNQRLYSSADIERLHHIRYLVEVRGLNVAGLEITLAVVDRLDMAGPDATRAELRTAVREAVGLSRRPEGARLGSARSAGAVTRP
jgi:MerR family transcriptional regulator/heat shock protein HspR